MTNFELIAPFRTRFSSSIPDLVFWPNLTAGGRNLRQKLVSVTKKQICDNEFNHTLLIMTYSDMFERGESYCKLLNGEILRRSQFVSDVKLFLDENLLIWKESCSNTVWTDMRKEVQSNNAIEIYEFYNAMTKNFHTTSHAASKCFICVLGERRSQFQMKTLKSYNENGIDYVARFTLKMMKLEVLSLWATEAI